MSAHTPGPWRYWSCRVDSRAEPQMFDYAQFANSRQDHVFRAPLRYLREEDARLIASAPELLEALRDCVTAMTALHCGEVARAEVISSARAAIAKATGGKQ